MLVGSFSKDQRLDGKKQKGACLKIKSTIEADVMGQTDSWTLNME